MASSIPSVTRETIRRSFGLLSQPCQEALLVAAAIGTEFGVETVSTICRRELGQVREAFDREAGAGLVSAVSGASGMYRFSDPAIRDLIYEEIPFARRPWLDRQIAESRTSRVNADRNGRVVERAVGVSNRKRSN